MFFEAVAHIMDKYTVYTHEIQGIDQELFIKAYDSIINGSNIVCNKFDEYSQYVQYMSQYCNYMSVEESFFSLVLSINVGDDSNYDLIDLQYLVELILKIKQAKSYEMVYLFFDTDSDNYFRISQTLRLWYIFHADNNSVWFRVTDKQKRTVSIRRLALRVAANGDSTVMPLCQLSPEMWKVFSIDGLATEEECNELNEYFNAFSELALKKQDLSQHQIAEVLNNSFQNGIDEARLYRLILSRYVRNKNGDNISNYPKSNCLTQFIFALYMVNRSEIESAEIGCIHEVCASYAQGIIQLIENSLIHPTKESKPHSFFSFRANTHPSRLEKYIEDTDKILSLLEFSISDIALFENKARGIISSFTYKHPEYKDITMENLFKFTYSNKDNPLYKYYSDVENVVNHFGLQIFSNIVKTYNGCFSVTSNGSNSKNEHFFEAGSLYRYHDVRRNCFFGTTYSVILPIEKTINKSKNYQKYIAENSLEATVNALKNNDDEYELKKIPVAYRERQISLFEQSIVLQHSVQDMELAHKLWGTPTNYCVRISPDVVNSVVGICKAVFVHLLKCSQLKNVVLFFDSDEDFLSAVRTCCLFYDRAGQSNLLANSKGLLLYNLTNKTEAYFCGSHLSSVLGGLSNQYVNGLLDCAAYNQIETIFGHQLTEFTNYGNYCADIAIKLLVKNPETNKYLIEEELYDVLNNDIHDRNIGCKISNTHFRVSKVHLDTYYEAQFLFGNSYWCKVFATYLANTIKKHISDFDRKIIIYGYEKYSAGTLSVARTLLTEMDYTSVDLLFYENGDPELDSNRVRFVESLPDGEYDVCYFVGISSTLSTFSQMDLALDRAIKEKSLKLSLNKVVCTSVVQIVEDNKNVVTGQNSNRDASSEEAGKQIHHANDEHIIESNNVDFVDGKRASYLVSVATNWYKPEKCKYCLTDGKSGEKLDFSIERPLIEVDETSVIPTLLYRLEDEPTESTRTFEYNFLNNLRKGNFVYAEHLKRKGNHYQYFLRLAHIYAAHKADIIDWLKLIMADNDFAEMNKRWCNGDSINIIVSPQQNSSNGFVDDVNQIIFGGRAHTIVFDIRKEYRKSFIAKYSFLKDHLNNRELNFFYVADHIIAGTTYNRTQSLISSLFGKNVPVFSAVFVLANRHSKKSQRTLLGMPANYPSDESERSPLSSSGPMFLPYFSFINLSIPSLRQHNCPACKKVSQYKNALKDSATVRVAYEFQKKILLEHEKTLKEIHEIYAKKSSDPEEDDRIEQLYKYNSDKLFIENQLWELFFEVKTPTIGDLIHKLNNEFSTKYTLKQRIQRLGILIDVITSPMLIYQEEVKSTSLKLVRDIHNELVQYYDSKAEGKTLKELNILCSEEVSEELRFLFEKTIWGLCYLGSTQFLQPTEIAKCISVYPYNGSDDKSFEKRLICFIKYMISNDKLKEFSFDDKGVLQVEHKEGELQVKQEEGSKSNILIRNLIEYREKNKNSDVWNNNISFWRLLYIEAVSAENRKVCVDDHDNQDNSIEVEGSYTNELLDGLPPRYKEYLDLVNSTPGIESVNIDLFVKVRDHYCNLSGFSVLENDDLREEALIRDGFYVDETSSKWFIKISNNKEALKEIKTTNENRSELIGTTAVNAIIMISFIEIPVEKQIEKIRRILLYKNQLLQMLVEDYEEELFSHLYELAAIKRSTHNTLGSHGNINWNEYQLVLHSIFNSQKDTLKSAEFYALMDVFRNAIISFANLVRVLRFNPYNIVLMFNDSPDRLEDALKVVDSVVSYFINEKKLKVNYRCDFCKDGKQYEFLMFGQSYRIDYFGLGVFAFIFLDNAYRHADTSKDIDLLIERCPGERTSYKMVLENHKNAIDSSNSAITIPSIINLFKALNNGSDASLPEVSEDNGITCSDIYHVELTNIIIEEVEDD